MEYNINEELAEETGIHVGDGSMNIYDNKKKYCYTVACHKDDDRAYMDNFVLPLIKRIYNKNPKPRFWSKGTYGFRICSIDIVKFKHKILGLPLGKKTNISVPEIILRDKKLMRYFVRGLFDTDGSITLWKRKTQLYPRIYFSTVSKKLMEQVEEFLIAESFVVSTWKTEYNNRNWNTIYKLHINGDKMLIKWVNEIGSANPKNIEKINTLGLKTKFYK